MFEYAIGALEEELNFWEQRKHAVTQINDITKAISILKNYKEE